MDPVLSGLLEPSARRPRLARITVEQYHRMLEAGVLRDGEPIELIDGLLVYKDRSAAGEDPMTVGKRHAVAVELLTELDRLVAPHGCHVRTQKPITLPPHHEPEPDGAIVRGVRRDYSKRHPGAADVCCAIEVSDSSLEHDRTVKLATYALAALPQYVIVNIPEGRLEVFEDPLPGEGRYAHVLHVAKNGTLSLNVGSVERVTASASDLLP